MSEQQPNKFCVFCNDWHTEPTGQNCVKFWKTMQKYNAQQDTRCGVRYRFLDLTLGENHPFTVVCRLEHDANYDAMKQGFPTRPVAEVDRAAFTAWWGIAQREKSLLLKTQALIFYPIIRVYSLFGWRGRK